jgi:hypothetical protein
LEAFLVKLLTAALSAFSWPSLEGETLSTPSGTSSFKIVAIGESSITIKTNQGTPIVIRKNAFLQAIKYLVINGHFDSKKHCEIRSNKDYKLAGPLCQFVREPNETMTITYILPILKFFGFVELANVNGLNSTWLT